MFTAHITYEFGRRLPSVQTVFAAACVSRFLDRVCESFRRLVPRLITTELKSGETEGVALECVSRHQYSKLHRNERQEDMVQAFPS